MGDRICVMTSATLCRLIPRTISTTSRKYVCRRVYRRAEMNIRPSQLVEHGGRLHLTLGDQRLPLNDRLQSKVETHKNQQVFFGVRPEFVSLSR